MGKSESQIIFLCCIYETQGSNRYFSHISVATNDLMKDR